jgi:hypothetical protein
MVCAINNADRAIVPRGLPNASIHGPCEKGYCQKREAEGLSFRFGNAGRYFALSSSFDFKVPVLSTGGATFAPSESPALQSGFLGSSVVISVADLRRQSWRCRPAHR